MRKHAGKLVIGMVVLAVVIGWAIHDPGTTAQAVPTDGGHPSAKATCKVANITLIDATEQQGWTTLLSNTIKTANKKDLFIDVSLECGLYTSTKVDSLGGIEDRAEAEAAVEVRVLVNSVEALPGPVNFARRSQVLVAEFQGLLTDEYGNVCLSADPNTGVITIDEDCLRPETLELILDTMNANSFNFVYADLRPGVYLIEVQAKIDTFTESTLDSGTKVKDSDDGTSGLTVGDDTLTVEKANKFEVGQTIVIDEEKLVVEAVDGSGKVLTVERGAEGTVPAFHADRTRIYIVAGAEAQATIGKGSVTVEEVRLIKGEDILL